MKKTYKKWFLSKVKKATKDYQMINSGDRIAVGVSGGKDSMALLFILTLLKKHSRQDFDFHAITLDLGQGADFSPLETFCQEAKIPLHVETTQIGEIVFDIRQEPNPCSLCAKLRRGALHRVALKLGCNKVALGHHLDDAIETFLLNIIYAGRQGTFAPSVFLDRTGLTLIRPMVYLPQETTTAIVERENLPIVPNPCPASGDTEREKMRTLVTGLAETYPDIREKFLSAFQNQDFNNLWKQRRPPALENLIPKLAGVPEKPSNPLSGSSEPEYEEDLARG